MRVRLLLFVVLIIFGAYGVQSQDDPSVRYRIGHLSPDAGRVDVYINGEIAYANLQFPTIREWVTSDTDTINITVTRPGGIAGEDILLGPVAITPDSGSWITLPIIGEQRNDTLEIFTLTEDYSPIAAGETRITVFNTVSGGFPLRLFANSTLLTSGLSYPGTDGDNDGAASTDIIAGSYSLRLENQVNDDVIFRDNGVALGRNRHYFLVATGTNARETALLITTALSDFQQPGPLSTDANTAITGPTRLRVGHFAPEAPPLDLYIDDRRVEELSTVAYVGLTDWQTLAPRVYKIAFALAGESVNEPVIGPFNVVLSGGEWNTIVVVGISDSENLVARIVREDYSIVPPGEARITLLHAVPDAPPLDISLDDQTFLGSVSFPGNAPSGEDGTATVTVIAQQVELIIREAGAPDVDLVRLSDVRLEPEMNYFIAIINNLDSIDYYLLSVDSASIVTMPPP